MKSLLIALFLLPAIVYSQFKVEKEEISVAEDDDIMYCVTNPDSTLILISGKLIKLKKVSQWKVELKDINFKVKKSVDLKPQVTYDASMNTLIKYPKGLFKIVKREKFLYVFIGSDDEKKVEAFQLNRKTLEFKSILLESKFYGAPIPFNKIVVADETVIFAYASTLYEVFVVKMNFKTGALTKEAAALNLDNSSYSLYGMFEVAGADEYAMYYHIRAPYTSAERTLIRIYNSSNVIVKEINYKEVISDFTLCKNKDNTYLQISARTDQLFIGRVTTKEYDEIQVGKVTEQEYVPITEIDLLKPVWFNNKWIIVVNQRYLSTEEGATRNLCLYAVSASGEIAWGYSSDCGGGVWKRGVPDVNFDLVNDKIVTGMHIGRAYSKLLVMQKDGKPYAETNYQPEKEDFLSRDNGETINAQWWYGNTFLVSGVFLFLPEKMFKKDERYFIFQKVNY